MLDIRTSREIMEFQAGSIKGLIKFESKVWVSQESLLLLLQRYDDLGHDEGIISCLTKDLLGDKE